MDSVICHHKTPRCSAQMTGGVTDRRPLGLPPRGMDSGAEAECPTGRGGPVGNHHWGPSPRCMSTAAGNKDGGLADSAAVNGKQDRTG